MNTAEISSEKVWVSSMEEVDRDSYRRQNNVIFSSPYDIEVLLTEIT